MADDKSSADTKVNQLLAQTLAYADHTSTLADLLFKRLEIAPCEGGYPKSFLLAMGAIAQLDSWEYSGVRRSLDLNLSGAFETFATLINLMRDEPALVNEWSCNLCTTVFRAWLHQTARTIHPNLHAEFVLKPEPMDDYLNEIAHFLWTHRGLVDPE